MSALSSFNSWDDLITTFREVGGELENVTIKEINSSRSLFAIDPTRPVKIKVPDELLVRVSDVVVTNGQLSVRDSADVSKTTKDFFQCYHRFTSWTGGGYEGCKFFLDQMFNLPDPIRSTLVSEFSLSSFFKYPTDQAILEQFFKSRQILKNNQNFLMPIMEFVNHSPMGGSYDTLNGIAFEGKASTKEGEILINYSPLDSWGKFVNYGFATPERFAFSEPFTISGKSSNFSINVRKQINLKHENADKSIRPVIEKKDNEIDVAFILLGDRKSAEVPMLAYKNYVYPYIDNNADEFFETLVYINRLKFLKLLESTEGFNSEIIELIRKVCRYQLETLSCCWFGNWAFSNN